MPNFNQDKSTRLNRERNLRPYEASVDDPRPIVDPELEYEADKSGMIHTRKHTSETTVLPGYGITDFGVSPFVQNNKMNSAGKFIIPTFMAAGLFVWKFRDGINDKLLSIGTYALLLREASKS